MFQRGTIEAYPQRPSHEYNCDMLTDSFLTYIRCELNYSAHTVLSYKNDISQWREFATAGKPETFSPLDITASDIRTWLRHLNNCGCSARTIRRKTQALRAFYHYLMKNGLTKHNPAAEIILSKTDNPLPAYIPQAETAEILDEEFDASNFVETRNRLIILMFYSTGMRKAELETLTDANVDNTRGELKVFGKRNKERIIPYGPELAEMIDRYRDRKSVV